LNKQSVRESHYCLSLQAGCRPVLLTPHLSPTPVLLVRYTMRKYYGYKQSHRTVKGVKQKRCTICERWKAESEFHKDRARTDGLKIRCKECNRTYEIELKRKRGRHARDYLRFEERHRTVSGVKQKLCTRCKQWKDESVFYKSRSGKDGLSDRCKKCSYNAIGKSRKKRSPQ
jgi:hypothetical protein